MKPWRLTRAAAGLAAAALAVAAGPALTASADTGPALVPTATAASDLAGATSLGAAPPATTLPVTVSLQPRDEAGLDALIAGQGNPASPDYHRYLTPAQFAARFAPTSAQVDQVVAYLRQQGLTQVAVSPNHLAVQAVATAASASRAFATPLGLFSQHGRQVVANTGTAQVPASLGSVVGGVIGLNQALHASPSPALPAAGVSTGSKSYNPPALATAYDATSLPAASATPIAIMAEGDLSQVVTDLRTEEKANGQPQVPVSIVRTGASSSDTSGLDEWDLDTQTSTAMAGNVSMLYLYDAPSLNDPDITNEIEAFVSQDKAPVGSASFGECDTDAQSDGTSSAVDTALKEAVAQGQTLFAASGDSGSQCQSVSGLPGVGFGPTETSYPASGTYTTGVGGTTLSTTSSNAYSSETAWNGSGGGRSSEATPSWATQADATAPRSSGSGGLGLISLPPSGGLTSVGGLAGLLRADHQAATSRKHSSGRGVPDLAMDADPNTGANIVVNGSTETVGGTSLSSPLAAGAWVRTENAHGGGLGNAGQAIYGLYNAANGTTAGPTPGLHDVTSGSNGAYRAAVGYDLVTGLGTMDVASLSSKV